MSSDNIKCEFRKGKRIVAVGERKNRLFEMKFKDCKKESINFPQINITHSLQTWHERLGHQHFKQVQTVLKNMDITFDDGKRVLECNACPLGKQHRIPNSANHVPATVPGEIIHSDLCGPMQEKSIGGAIYFLLFKDDFSHFRTIIFIQNKSDVKTHIKNFLSSVKVDTGHCVKVLRTDNGTEYINNAVETM